MEEIKNLTDELNDKAARCVVVAVRGGRTKGDEQHLEPRVLRRVRSEEEKKRRHLHGDSGAKFQAKEWLERSDGLSNTITSVTKDNLLLMEDEEIPEMQTLRQAQILVQGKRDGSATAVLEKDMTIRGCYNVGTHDSSISEMVVNHEKNASHTITSANSGKVYGKTTRYRIRKYTPRECFRLMGVSESDIDRIQASGVSNSQQYKMAGNSIVVPCLYHIFRKMFVQKECETEHQLTLF